MARHPAWLGSVLGLGVLTGLPASIAAQTALPAPAPAAIAAPAPTPDPAAAPAQAPTQVSAQAPLPAPTVAPLPAPAAERVLVDQLAGGANRGAWGVSLQGGFPFFTLRAQLGVAPGLASLAEVETVLGRRFTASLGLSLAWLRRPRIRLSGEVLLGWMLQETELPRRGPSGELRLRLAVPTRWVVPYLVLGTRHAFLPSRTRIERESGTDTLWSIRHEWTPTASLGLGIHVHRRVGLDVGADYGWVDAPGSVALPGFHLGVHVGGGR